MFKEELWTLKQNGKISSGLPMWADFHRSANKRICSCCHYSKSRCFVEAIFGFDFRLIFALIAFFSLEDTICKSVANIRGHILASNFWIQFPDIFVLILFSLSEDLVLAEERTSKKDRQRIMEGEQTESMCQSSRWKIIITIIRCVCPFLQVLSYPWRHLRPANI